MLYRIAPPTLNLETVRGIEVDVELAADDDRKEPLYLWNDTLQELKQITDADLQLLCFPGWRPTAVSLVQDGQPVILSYGLGADSTALLLKYLSDPDGRQYVAKRPASASLSETQSFMDGEKEILIFSGAGNAGRSYHADLGCQNTYRRVHYLLEAGWQADGTIQGLGRSHRTNQAKALIFRPVVTDVRGERRFISTIARRLDALGALTRGQRQTGG